MKTYGAVAPVIVCERTERGDWRFWCPHCRRFHYHGVARGHRIAHCTDPRSPFKETGYVLAEREDQETTDD